VPVGDGHHAGPRHLATDVSLGDDRRLQESEHLRSVVFRDEQVPLLIDIARGEVTLAMRGLPLEGVKQPVVHDEPRCDKQEVAREALVGLSHQPVEVLPDKQRVQNPSLTSTRGHFGGVLRVIVPLSCDLAQHSPIEHGVARNRLVQLAKALGAQHLVGIDDVDDGSALALVEVEGTQVDEVLLKPELEEFCGGRCYLAEQLRLQPSDQVGYLWINQLGDAGSERETIPRLGHRFIPTSTMTTSDSKPNTSTARTQTRRSPSPIGICRWAVVTTRRGSLSCSVLPR